MTNCSHGTAKACGHDEHGGHTHTHLGGARLQLAVSLLAGLLLLSAWLLNQTGWSQRSLIVGWTLPSLVIAASFLLAGFFAAADALSGVLAGRFQIDFLMVAAAIGAAAIGHVGEGALLLVLFSLGHTAEHYATSRAQRTIAGLADLRPTVAMLWDAASGQTRQVPVEQLQLGDLIVVPPDSRIAADGIVVHGESFVAQAEITGESLPVEKRPPPQRDSGPSDDGPSDDGQGEDGQEGDGQGGDGQGAEPSAWQQQWSRLPDRHRLYAGTINGSGVLRLRVARTADNSTLARIAALVATARTHRSPTQRLAQQFERRFVPAVLLLVVLLPLAFLVIDEPASASLYRAITVLVAASPCALAIATPSAVLSAVARGGREGIVFKGGGPLEQLGRVQTMAFDKTGTLTSGWPEVVEVITADGLPSADLLAFVAAVETLSDHPLASAILAAADAQRPAGELPQHAFQVDSWQRLAGRGVHAIVDGEPAWIGNRRLFSSASSDGPVGLAGPIGTAVHRRPALLPDWVDAAATELQQRGQTIMIVCYGDDFLGVIGLQDRPRPRAAEALNQLRRSGIDQIAILSGDHAAAVQAVASGLPVDQVHSDLSPEDKWRWIRDAATRRPVAMVGDGVNDAPALAAATVSVAMGGAGSELALETADVVLMSDDLSKLPRARQLSWRAARVVRQNLLISLGVIAVLVPAALLGIPLAVAVVVHEGSTLLVVANALRLLR